MHREHPANEVFVTGTFDNWNKTQKLEKKGNVFEKEVSLPIAEEKIYYKVRILFSPSITVTSTALFAIELDSSFVTHPSTSFKGFQPRRIRYIARFRGYVTYPQGKNAHQLTVARHTPVS